MRARFPARLEISQSFRGQRQNDCTLHHASMLRYPLHEIVCPIQVLLRALTYFTTFGITVEYSVISQITRAGFRRGL
jgi:hypothetical protein